MMKSLSDATHGAVESQPKVFPSEKNQRPVGGHDTGVAPASDFFLGEEVLETATVCRWESSVCMWLSGIRLLIRGRMSVGHEKTSCSIQ